MTRFGKSIAILIVVLVFGVVFISSSRNKNIPVSPTPPQSVEHTTPSDSTTPEPLVSPPNAETPGECFIGGCSGQICSDQEHVISTCEAKPEYACYKTAKCERQASGECGWTETAELVACVKNSSSSSSPGVY